MQELVLLGTFVLCVACGLLTPFVFSLGYVWVDTMVPNRLSYSILGNMPASFIMAAGALLVYVLMDRRAPPRLTPLHALCVVFAAWITLTTTWSVVPEAAWLKWDPSFKALLFTAFLPFVFRSRVQIEACLLVFMAGSAAHLIPWGLKTFVTGGGYNQALGLLGVNEFVLAESSSVAGVAASFVPLLLWFRTHSLLVPSQRVRTVGVAGMIAILLSATIGTFARTGVIALGILGGAMFVYSKRKVLFIIGAFCAVALLSTVASNQWEQRIDTISDYQSESSALVRLLVWKWTMGLVQTHPLGGGFRAYMIDRIELPDGSVAFGRAFHNTYFAVLGEHGFPGLAIYLSILGLTIKTFYRLIRLTKPLPDLAWLGGFAQAGLIGLLVLMASQMFVDLSFLFVLWYFVAFAMCLNAHFLRATAAQTVPRAIGAPALAGAGEVSSLVPR